MENKNLLLLFIGLMLIVSCKPKDNKDNKDNKDINTVNDPSKVQDTLISLKPTLKERLKVDTVFDGDFVMNVLDNDLTLEKLLEIYKPKSVQKKATSNVHNNNYKDTTIVFNDKIDSVSFYKGHGNTSLLNIHISSKRVTIDNNIQIGAKKELFEKRFKKESLSDVVIVQDIEGGNEFTFYFDNDILNKILFQIKYLD